MDNTMTYNELLELRNYQLKGLEATERLIKKYEESQTPRNPRKRRNLKDKRIEKFDQHFMSGKFKSGKNMLDQALKRHGITNP